MLGLEDLFIWVFCENSNVVSLNEGFGYEWYQRVIDENGKLCIKGKISKNKFENKTGIIRKRLEKFRCIG